LGTLEGIPPIQLSFNGNGVLLMRNGVLSIPGTYATATINNSSFNRGYIQSWNITVQKELRYGFVGQAGYVATRATDMMNGLNVNAGQFPGLGTAGQSLYLERTATATVYEPLGTNQVLPNVQIYGKIGATASYFNPLAFAPVTTATFGNAGFTLCAAPAWSWSISAYRAIFTSGSASKPNFDAFNFLNTPHFGLPNTNVSNMVLNSDGTVKTLGSFSTITSTQNLGCDFDERHIQFYLRCSF
jgi:hypothetical protein